MWESKFLQDTENKGVGTAYAMNSGFVYSRRMNTENGEDLSLFCDEAKSKFKEQQDHQDEVNSVAEKIKSVLNQ